MRFKLVENLPESARETLLSRGHDIHTVAQEQLAGASDPAVLAACIREGRILITLDLDFSDIRRYPPGTYPGIWVLRPTRQTFSAIRSLLIAALQGCVNESAAGALWIVDDRRIRIRDGKPLDEQP